jgi:hypothetical protein
MSAVAFAPVAVLLLVSGSWLASRGRKVGYFFALVAVACLVKAVYTLIA